MNNKNRKGNRMATLSAPWVTYYRKIEALFGNDPQVNVQYDEEGLNIKIYVESGVKAEAIEKLLPTEKEFGNVKVKITVIPANNQSILDVFKTAFDGNPALSFVKTVSSPITGDTSYVVFANKVVQFFNDDLSDINGNVSTLYQEIAKDVLGCPTNLFFCTDNKTNSKFQF